VAAPGFLAPGGKCHLCHICRPLPWLQSPSFGALSLWRPGAIAPLTRPRCAATDCKVPTNNFDLTSTGFSQHNPLLSTLQSVLDPVIYLIISTNSLQVQSGTLLNVLLKSRQLTSVTYFWSIQLDTNYKNLIDWLCVRRKRRQHKQTISD
jgi:hypothetical protein